MFCRIPPEHRTRCETMTVTITWNEQIVFKAFGALKWVRSNTVRMPSNSLDIIYMVLLLLHFCTDLISANALRTATHAQCSKRYCHLCGCRCACEMAFVVDAVVATPNSIQSGPHDLNITMLTTVQCIRSNPAAHTHTHTLRSAYLAFRKIPLSVPTRFHSI